MWLLRSPARLLVLLAAAWIVHASAQLTDAPLRLPGRPAPQSGVTAAAGASQAEERAGYFGIPGTQRRLFYWFFQARSPSSGAPLASAPLLIWLQGGPGCSSLFGVFFEHGPWGLNATLGLVPNPHTWAAAANLLYIDQPIGTGLSYSRDASDKSASQLDVAKTLAAFLQAFYKAPQYGFLARSNLILAGESFAGHYLPATAAHIKANVPALPLAGVLMVAPFTNAPAMYESYARWALQRDLIPSALFKSVQSALAACKLQSALCNTVDPAACEPASQTCEYLVWSALVRGTGSQLAARNLYNVRDTGCSACYAYLDQRLEAYVAANRQRLGVPHKVGYSACADPPYMALWGDMTRSYDDLLGALLDNDVNVMVVSGDDDFVCNSLGTTRWVDALIWSRQAGWASVKPASWNGGTFRRLGPLAFVRVNRAGHMVPMDQPALSLQLLQQWLATGQPAAKKRP
ncbi:serine carboxypeptidase-like [Micractinium conductrix]|uniref:Serine carboxypeptidase-like n=1 Tax=Micractinium conductrix TaxID=554055 RepID=A0A2P6VQ29_9CHLO|nr:serine carboxypeptidase-like [Micractinium conductrix]|eukprot:PSC76189.1 serine carboxypeptidase-like [Micractinium conductrix]